MMSWHMNPEYPDIIEVDSPVSVWATNQEGGTGLAVVTTASASVNYKLHLIIPLLKMVVGLAGYFDLRYVYRRWLA